MKTGHRNALISCGGTLFVLLLLSLFWTTFLLPHNRYRQATQKLAEAELWSHVWHVNTGEYPSNPPLPGGGWKDFELEIRTFNQEARGLDVRDPYNPSQLLHIYKGPLTRELLLLFPGPDGIINLDSATIQNRDIAAIQNL